ncbi:hypothetical protein [Psychroserpens mesophilus]|uniref:hypothetical protein n=1 Tax=Psychroserpens mesophilus TaxID=325473 RepID=UPI003D65BD11
MKIIFKLALALIVVSLFTCSSDDDNINDNDVSVEGVWVLSALSVESSFDFNNDGIASRNLFEETPCYNDDFINFRTDGTVNVVTALTYISIEITSPTEYEHVYQCLDGLNQETTWTRNGNTITVENGTTDFVGVISGNILTVSIENLFEIEMYDGMDYSYPEEDVVLVYTKL